jgi:transketolase
MKQLIIELLNYSFKHKLSHIPSALSMLTYVDVLFSSKFVTPEDYIVIGKPFGAQTYYLIWQNLGYVNNIETLSVGVKHDEISFVDFSEETMGNALGVAAGIAMTTDRLVWVNISDGALQMGNTLEAIQFIGHNKIKNIFLTIDYNNEQVTGSVNDILNVKPILRFFKEYGWFTQEANGHNTFDLHNKFKNITNTLPNVVFCHTKKGHGVRSIQDNPKKWHYKQIETLKELQLLVEELADT